MSHLSVSSCQQSIVYFLYAYKIKSCNSYSLLNCRESLMKPKTLVKNCTLYWLQDNIFSLACLLKICRGPTCYFGYLGHFKFSITWFLITIRHSEKCSVAYQSWFDLVAKWSWVSGYSQKQLFCNKVIVVVFLY